MAFAVGTYPITITLTSANGATYTETSEVVIVEGVSTLTFNPATTTSVVSPLALNANNAPTSVVLDFVPASTASVVSAMALSNGSPIVLDFAPSSVNSVVPSITLDANNPAVPVVLDFVSVSSSSAVSALTISANSPTIISFAGVTSIANVATLYLSARPANLNHIAQSRRYTVEKEIRALTVQKENRLMRAEG